MQPKERVVRRRRGKLEEPILSGDGDAAPLLRQLTTRETGLAQEGLRVDPIFLQIA